MDFKRRIFISFQNPNLLDDRRKAIQDHIIRKIEQLRFQPEMFFHAGDAASRQWSLQNVLDIMKKCMGAVVIALPRWEVDNNRIPSEYAQIEGAIATTLRIPLLIITENPVVCRGITCTGGGNPILFMPSGVNTDWFNTDAFRQRFDIWTNQLAERSDVFLGYCSQAQTTANAVQLFLTRRLNLRVRDWRIDFQPSGFILEQIEKITTLCSGGIFLFTKDDALNGNELYAAPRDNVVFEAGYFAAAKGRDRVLIIREEGAKMPADLGGHIYLTLKDKGDTAPIESALAQFIQERL